MTDPEPFLIPELPPELGVVHHLVDTVFHQLSVQVSELRGRERIG
jgi:hypothetical protein